MSENIRVVVTGVSGRMGQMIVSGVLSSTKTRLVGALEREGHDWIGKDLGLVSGLNTLGVEVSDDPASVFKDTDAIIDFSAPKASVEFSKLAAERGIVHVIGTTGFNDQELALIENSGKKAKIIRAGNMSLGVNLLVQLTKKVAATLDLRASHLLHSFLPSLFRLSPATETPRTAFLVHNEPPSRRIPQPMECDRAIK